MTTFGDMKGPIWVHFQEHRSVSDILCYTWWNWNLQFAAKEEECCQTVSAPWQCTSPCSGQNGGGNATAAVWRSSTLPLQPWCGTMRPSGHLKRLYAVAGSPLMRLRKWCRPGFRSSWKSFSQGIKLLVEQYKCRETRERTVYLCTVTSIKG